MSDSQAVRKKRDISLMLPIFGSHIRRLGWARTLIGALPMYLCIPILVVIHLTTVVLFFQWCVRPMFGLHRLSWRDYVVIDRHRIDDLPAFDKFNCMFCGYANGLVTMVNKETDHIAGYTGPAGVVRQAALFVLMVLMLPLGLLYELHFQVIYNLMVSGPLGMHRVSIKEAGRTLRDHGYADHHPVLLRGLLRSSKNLMLRFALALEQIESSWCPLRHFERREGIVYPEHHKRFFGPEEVDQMRLLLCSEGTVSPRKPRW